MPSQQHPRHGESLTATFKVQQSDLASAVSPDYSDKYPFVLATARVVALMKIAAARMIVPYLEPGQLSVGVTVDVTRTKPTPPGETVKVETLTSIYYIGRHRLDNR